MVITEFGPVENLELVQQTGLPEPGQGEVRIRVLTASASFTDVMVRRGHYQGIEAEPPFAPGYDLVGIVDALGPGVSGINVGDRVADLTVWGSYSEYITRPAAGLVPVPEQISDEDAVVLILAYTTAYQMLYRVAEVRPDQRILIHGASGAVGTALAQLGRMSGLKMWGTASKAKAEYVQALGVRPIDYRSEDFVERINSETNGEGVDFVFDAIGPDNFKRSYTTLASDGLLVEYGLYNTSLRGDRMDVIRAVLSWQWQELLWKFFPDENRATTFYSIADMRATQPDWFREDLRSLFNLTIEGNIAPQVWSVMPMARAQDAHRAIEQGEVRGKIVLRVTE